MARRLAFTSTASPGQLLHALGGLTEVLAAGSIADGDEAEGLRRYAEHVECIGEAASDAAYPGLQDVCLLFRESLQSLSERSAPLTETQRSRLNAWPELVQAYIESPGSPDIAAALIDYLRDPSWDSALSEDDAEMLKAMLAESSTGGIDQAALAQGELALEASPGFANIEAPELPAAVRELVEILLTELPQIEVSVSSLVGLASSEGIDADVMSESFEHSAEIIERLGSATESVGFHGLYGACRQVCENLRIIATERLALNAGEAKLLQDWVAQVRAYLTAPAHPAPTQGLVHMLAAPWWPKPLMDAELEFLRSQLLAPDLSTLQEESVSRQQLATADDVSLELPEDVNQDLLDGLLQELPNQTEEFSAAIQRLIKGGTLEDVNIAQRIAHTLKGAGNTVGVRGLAHLTHHLEDILLALTKHQTLPTRSLAETMMNAADCLEGMTEALLGMANPPADAQAVLQGVLDWANRIDHEGLPTGDETVSSPVLAQVTPLTERAEPSKRQTAAPTTEQRKETEESSGAVPMMRVPASLVDNLLRLVGETIILTGQIHERLRQATSDARAMQTQFDLLQQLGAELEEFIDIKDFSSRQQAQARDPGFDALEMDQYNELHTYNRRLVEAALDAREMGRALIEHLADLDDMLVNQEGLNRENQEAVLHTRMVPVKSVFPRLTRSVRQTCRLTGKQAELSLSGGDTLMDSDILNDMVDPLMHLLRNAVDHGIEDADTRRTTGKNPTGNIYLDFLRDGNNILVRCRDDGAGLDFMAIRRTAEQRGLIGSDREISEDDLKRFILRPNFSTRSQATPTSGRGIGLDAVYSSVLNLGGTLTLRSVANQGCTFELRLPFTLISSHALLVRSGPQVLAVASRGIEQILHPEDGEVRQFGSDQIFLVDNNVYPLRALESVLNTASGRRETERHMRSIIIVRAEEGLSAVMVESILESRDLVVKSLGHYIPKLRGIVGATILGDGSVTPVLDLPELLRVAHPSSDELSVSSVANTKERPNLPCALVVDDSLSARRALAQFIADSGFEVHTARDGMEAVQLIEQRRPDILLADLEMPRMNGVELTSHIRAQSATAKLPVIMITSRTAPKHRQQAEAAGVNVYLNKPFSEEDLLEHVRELLGQS